MHHKVIMIICPGYNDYGGHIYILHNLDFLRKVQAKHKAAHTFVYPKTITKKKANKKLLTNNTNLIMFALTSR